MIHISPRCFIFHFIWKGMLFKFPLLVKIMAILRDKMYKELEMTVTKAFSAVWGGAIDNKTNVK